MNFRSGLSKITDYRNTLLFGCKENDYSCSTFLEDFSSLLRAESNPSKNTNCSIEAIHVKNESFQGINEAFNFYTFF